MIIAHTWFIFNNIAIQSFVFVKIEVKKLAAPRNKKSFEDFMEELNIYHEFLSECVNNDNNADLIEMMNSFRDFLKKACIISNGYFDLFEQFIQNPKYLEFRDFFMFCEAYHERLIEIKEKESLVNKKIDISSFEKSLTLEYNKKFYQDILTEFKSLQEYMSATKKFVMVGCGSFPITLFSIAQKYQHIQSTGIDISLEAIINAKELKNKLKYSKITFDIIDGANFNYRDYDTIFIANLVIPKTEVLKRIATTCKPGTIIFMRVPVLYGNLLSEDVNYVSMNCFELIDSIEPSDMTDDILYKIIVLKKI